MEIQSLKDSLINIGLQTLQTAFSNFKCEKDEDIERFLTEYVVEYENKNVCRTFFVMDSKYPGEIIGYFSIGLNVMHFDEQLEIDDAYEGINLYENGYRPIYKLFMFGKNSLYSNAVKMAEIFNNELLAYIRDAQEYVGGELMYIDCEPQLKTYYTSLGFTYYDDVPQHNLIRMIRKI